jgi:hypothetical protein
VKHFITLNTNRYCKLGNKNNAIDGDIAINKKMYTDKKITTKIDRQSLKHLCRSMGKINYFHSKRTGMLYWVFVCSNEEPYIG